MGYMFLIIFISFLIEFYIIMYISKKLFKRNSRSIIPILIIIILYSIIKVFSMFYYPSFIFTIILFMYPLIILLLLFEGNLFKKVLWYIIFALAVSLSEIIVMLITEQLIDIPSITISDMSILLFATTSLLSKLVTLTLLYFIVRVTQSHNTILKVFKYEFALIAAVSMVSVSLAIYIYYNYSIIYENPQQMFSTILILISFNIVVFIILFLKITQKSSEHIEKNKQIERLENEIKLNTAIEISERNLKAMRHNISNIFSVIGGLVDIQAYDELKKYVDDINEDVHAANELVFLDNKALSILVNMKNNTANKNKVNFKSLISTYQLTNMRDNDLCDLMGNIWDNAIEAALQGEDFNFVTTTMALDNNHYCIRCENNYAVEPVIKNNQFISSKRDSNNEHGIGTKVIKDIVKKYNGNLEYSFESNICTLEITFPIKVIDQNKLEIIID